MLREEYEKVFEFYEQSLKTQFTSSFATETGSRPLTCSLNFDALQGGIKTLSRTSNPLYGLPQKALPRLWKDREIASNHELPHLTPAQDCIYNTCMKGSARQP